MITRGYGIDEHEVIMAGYLVQKPDGGKRSGQNGQPRIPLGYVSDVICKSTAYTVVPKDWVSKADDDSAPVPGVVSQLAAV